MKIVLISALGLVLAGCATVTRGTTNQVTLNSEPAGAEAKTSMGYHCPSTPCTFEVSRKAEFIVTFSKSGYKTTEVPVATRVAGGGVAGFAGNVLIGGLVGMGVDAATGSTLEHFPNPVFVTLQPIGKVAPPPRKPAPKAKPADAPQS